MDARLTFVFALQVEKVPGEAQSGYQEEEEIWLSFAPEEVNVYNCKLQL